MQALAWVFLRDPELVREMSDAAARAGEVTGTLRLELAGQLNGPTPLYATVEHAERAIDEKLMEGKLTVRGRRNGAGDLATLTTDHWREVKIKFDADRSPRTEARPSPSGEIPRAITWFDLVFSREEVLRLWPSTHNERAAHALPKEGTTAREAVLAVSSNWARARYLQSWPRPGAGASDANEDEQESATKDVLSEMLPMLRHDLAGAEVPGQFEGPTPRLLWATGRRCPVNPEVAPELIPTDLWRFLEIKIEKNEAKGGGLTYDDLRFFDIEPTAFAAAPMIVAVPEDDAPPPASVGDARALESAPYVRFMHQVMAALGNATFSKKVIELEIRNRWNESLLGPISDRMVGSMATFLRKPSAKRGGYFKKGDTQ